MEAHAGPQHLKPALEVLKVRKTLYVRESQEIYNEVNMKKSKWKKKQEIVEFKGNIIDDMERYYNNSTK